MILLQERKSLTWSDDDISVGGLKLTGKDFKEGGFSGAVGADETVTVSLCKFDVYIFKQSFFTNSQCDVIC